MFIGECQNKKERFFIMKRKFLTATCFLSLFVLWTILICFVDVKAIGPNNSEVGFAALNGFLQSLTGVNMTLYTITDWLGLLPVAVAFSFAVLGLVQWIKRKSLMKVDYSLFILGAFYLATIAVYVLFENVVINYRPVLINNFLEVSYPSSTTLLTLCVMPTAVLQLKSRIKNLALKRITIILIYLFTAFMVVARLISGVHWFTDIIGGVLISVALVTFYRSLTF